MSVNGKVRPDKLEWVTGVYPSPQSLENSSLVRTGWKEPTYNDGPNPKYVFEVRRTVFVHVTCKVHSAQLHAQATDILEGTFLTGNSF